jgi:hypothetical protein
MTLQIVVLRIEEVNRVANGREMRLSALGGNRVTLAKCRLLPVFPEQRTSSGQPGMSQMCQWATSHAWFDMKEAAH